MAFVAAAGLLASAAPGLATEQPDPVAPLTASSPAAPAQPATGPAAPTDDPDDESSADDPDDASATGGWAGNTRTADDEPDSESSDDSETGDDSRDDDDDDGDYADEDEDSDEDSATRVRYGTQKQTKAEKAAAERSAKKAKVLQKKAQKKAAAAKKSSSGKKKKAKQQAAKKMKQQAVRAAKRAAARDAAERRSAQQQRRAVADDDRGDNPRSGGSVDSLRDAILELTNRARKSAGCGTVRYSTQLEKSAQAHANDMAQHNYMSHQSRSGKNSDQRIRATGFNGDKTGENLGEGFSAPEAVFKAWMGSPSHRRNILDCGFRILGVGYNGGYWAQHFGG